MPTRRTLFALAAATLLPARPAAADPDAALDALLGRYVADHPDGVTRVRYGAWKASAADLRALEATPIAQQPPTLAVIAQGDEVLDWREMLAAYGADRVRLIPGSDHALSDFEDHLPEVLAFLGLA